MTLGTCDTCVRFTFIFCSKWIRQKGRYVNIQIFSTQVLSFAGESHHKGIYLQLLRLLFYHTFRVIIKEEKNVEWQGEEDGVFHNVLTLKAKWSISYAELSLLCFISTSRTDSWVVPQNLPWCYTMSYFITHIFK